MHQFLRRFLAFNLRLTSDITHSLSSSVRAPCSADRNNSMVKKKIDPRIEQRIREVSQSAVSAAGVACSNTVSHLVLL